MEPMHIWHLNAWHLPGHLTRRDRRDSFNLLLFVRHHGGRLCHLPSHGLFCHLHFMDGSFIIFSLTIIIPSDFIILSIAGSAGFIAASLTAIPISLSIIIAFIIMVDTGVRKSIQLVWGPVGSNVRPYKSEERVPVVLRVGVRVVGGRRDDETALEEVADVANPKACAKGRDKVADTHG